MNIYKKFVLALTVVFFVSFFFLVTPVKAETIIKNGTLSSNETWTSNDIYYINGDLTIPYGVTLTVNQGTIIKICNDVRIFVFGQLNSIGDPENITYITSYKDDTLGGDTNGDGLTFPAFNDWGWIEFGPDSSGNLDYTTIRYSGNSAATYNIGAIYVNNSYFQFPIVGDNVTLENNAKNGIHLRSGALSLSFSKTLPNYPSVPYYLSGDLTIPSGSSLTLGSGTIFKVNDNARIFVNGSFNSIGSPTNRTYITSHKDDTLGGDTNGDGLTFPAFNDWGWIEFGQESSGNLDYTTIRYSGNSAATYNIGAIYVNNSYFQFPIVGENVILENNAKNGIHLPGGALSLSFSKTLPNYPSVPYYLSGDLTIPSGSSLTLGSGTIFKVNDNARIFVNGSFNSIGSPTNRTYITSHKDDTLGGDTNGDGLTFPAFNDWGWIEFGPESSGNLDYTTIRFSGNSAATYKIGAIFANNSNYQFPTIGDNVILEKNSINGIHLPGGSLPLFYSKTMQNFPSVPYYLSGDLTVPNGSSLTVKPGVILKLNDSAQIIVNGTFSSVGDQDNFIYLTSYKDDYVGGDTNGDGLTSPAINDWGWIEFNSESSGSFEYTWIRYGGRNGSTYRGGLLINAGSTTVNQSYITNNNIGLEVNDANAISIHTSDIYSNNAYGIKNNQSGFWVDATNNWWGHISGPLDTSSADGLYNPLGLGDKVTDYVDYSPWTTGINYTDFIYLPMLLK